MIYICLRTVNSNKMYTKYNYDRRVQDAKIVD